MDNWWQEEKVKAGLYGLDASERHGPMIFRMGE